MCDCVVSGNSIRPLDISAVFEDVPVISNSHCLGRCTGTLQLALAKLLFPMCLSHFGKERLSLDSGLQTRSLFWGNMSLIGSVLF